MNKTVHAILCNETNNIYLNIYFYSLLNYEYFINGYFLNLISNYYSLNYLLLKCFLNMSISSFIHLKTYMVEYNYCNANFYLSFIIFKLFIILEIFIKYT